MGRPCEQPSDEDDSFGIRNDYGWIRLFLRQGNSSRERGFSGRNSCRKSESEGGPSRVCARAVVRPTIADLKWTLNRLANGSSFPIVNCTFTERPQSYVPNVRLDRPPGNWRGGLFIWGLDAIFVGNLTLLFGTRGRLCIALRPSTAFLVVAAAAR